MSMVTAKVIAEDELSLLNPNKLYYRNLYHGEKFKIHGIPRNNPVELVAGFTKCSKVRSIIPPISISIWIKNTIATRGNF